MKILITIREMFLLIVIQLSQNIIMIQRKLVADKLKNVTRSAAIDKFVGLKPKMHFFGK